jgi:CHAT domain-containing protein
MPVMLNPMPVRPLVALAIALLLQACTPEKPVTSQASQEAAQALVEQTGFVPPPRSLSDVIAKLEAEIGRRDAQAARRAADVSEAEGGPVATDRLAPATQSPAFVQSAEAAQRAAAALAEGRLSDARDAARSAASIARQAKLAVLPDRIDLQALAEAEFGNRRAGIALYAEASQLFERSRDARGNPNRMFHAMRAAAQAGRNASYIGDVAAARQHIARAREIHAGFARGPHAPAWDAIVLVAEADFLQSQGRPAESERKLRETITAYETMEARRQGGMQASSPTVYRASNVTPRVTLARNLLAGWRFAEAEVNARIALSEALDLHGPFHGHVMVAGSVMADIALAQGRYDDARQLSATLLRIGQMQGLPAGNARMRSLRQYVIATDFFRDRHAETVAGFEALIRDVGADRTAGTDPIFRNRNYAGALVALGRGAEALDIAERMLQRHLGDGDVEGYRAQLARALRGLALAASGNATAALVDLDATREAMRRGPPGDAAAGEGLAGWTQSLRRIVVTGMIGFYASLPTTTGRDFAGEAFELADVVRSLSVQGAIDALGQRAGVRDPALAELVRGEQDAVQAATALQATLVNLVAMPAAERDRAIEAEVSGRIAALEAEAARLGAAIRRSFPGFDELRHPARPSLDAVRRRLAPEEALVSYFVARDATYAWAVRREGQVGFARIPVGDAELSRHVGRLRAVLDTNAATVDEIPEFDVELSRRLHATLVAPLSAAIGDATTLVVVPHGPLSQIPFAIMATGAAPDLRAPVGEPRFSRYAQVPWLIRQVAVVQVPSVAAMIGLRSMPEPASGRLPFAGFGDAWFNPEQAAQARRTVALDSASPGIQSRGIPLARRAAPATTAQASLGVGHLARLPETADELRSVAQALGATPDAVALGDAATERRVRTMDLSRQRVVMFATHGLVPGDLDGLSQPALALTPSQVAGSDGGDGLLTMGDILALRLDADWVVLSACNTAAGNGQGAEAMSGLGRAFFYAGARALLVTYWPVETESAKRLTTDLFARQAADPTLSRARALRETMLAMIDGTAVADGTAPAAQLSHAHPLFWAPFGLLGDGGGRR